MKSFFWHRLGLGRVSLMMRRLVFVAGGGVYECGGHAKLQVDVSVRALRC